MAVCPCIKTENKKSFQGHSKIFQFETRHQYRGTNICIWQKSSSLASACIVNAWNLALDSLLTWNGLCLFCLLTLWTRPPWPAERGKIKYRPPPLGDGYIERLPLTADPINHPPSERLWSPQPPHPSSTTTLPQTFVQENWANSSTLWQKNSRFELKSPTFLFSLQGK